MGGVNLPEGGGRRTLDFDLNLVPFIDLLSCCIAFLLITAAWTQLARLETVQKVQKDGESGGKPEDKVQLVVFDWGYEVLPPGKTESCGITKRQGGDYDRGRLRRELTRMQTEKPEMTIVAVAAEDELDFIEVVNVMEICVDLGLINVTLGEGPGFRGEPPPCGGG
jgi:biopolymer transport protein ExbD